MRIPIVTRGQLTVCALVHKAVGRRGSRVHSGTARSDAGTYTWNMQLASIKPTIAMLRVSAAFTTSETTQEALR